MPRNNPNWGMQPREMNIQYGLLGALLLGAAVAAFFVFGG